MCVANHAQNSLIRPCSAAIASSYSVSFKSREVAKPVSCSCQNQLGGNLVNQDFGSIVVRLTAVASTAPRRLCASTPIAPLKRPNTIAPSRLLLNQECGQRCRSGQSPHSRVLSAFQNYNSSNGSRPKHRFLRR